MTISRFCQSRSWEFLSREPGHGSKFGASGPNGSPPVEYTSERTDHAFSPGLQHETTAVNGEYCLPQNFLVGFVKTRGHFGHCWGSGGASYSSSVCVSAEEGLGLKFNGND